MLENKCDVETHYFIVATGKTVANSTGFTYKLREEVNTVLRTE